MIIADPASTPNEKELAKKALSRRGASYKQTVKASNVDSALSVAYFLGVSVEYSKRDSSVVLCGDKKAVKYATALLDIWDQNSDAVNAAVAIGLFRELPLPSRESTEEPERAEAKTRFVRGKKPQLREITEQEEALVSSLIRKITRMG